MEWAQVIAGFGVGTLIGLTGVGGGSLMTPLLIFVFGVAPITAVGTDLLFAAITKAGGLWRHGRLNNIRWDITGLMLAGSIPTSLLTVHVLGHFTADSEALTTLVNSTLGVALALTSLVLIYKSRVHSLGRRIVVRRPQWKQWRRPATILTGVLLGALVPISSIGAGALGTAVLLFLYPSMSLRRIVGTDLAHAVPLTAIAGLGHMQLGTVDTTLLLTLLAGSLPGIYLGSHISTIVSDRVMRTILASLLMLIGVKFMLAN